VIARWEAGRAEIDAMLAAGYLDRVTADRSIAVQTISLATTHLESSLLTVDLDPVGSFQLAYDASRKALSAVLENQGLRATSRGGHRVVEDALRAQLVPPLGKHIADFGWMRTLRNSSQYLRPDRPIATREDALHAHVLAADLIELATRLLDQMPVY
jgi:hypothetical protein